jgi:hypothetical protein
MRSHDDTDIDRNSGPDSEPDDSEADTLELVDRRQQTATLPVSSERARDLFARFLKKNGMRAAVRCEFSPLGGEACLMHCEVPVGRGNHDDMSRLMSDFREFVAGVSSLS